MRTRRNLSVFLFVISISTALSQPKVTIAVMHMGNDNVGMILVYEVKKLLKEDSRFEIRSEGDAMFTVNLQTLSPLAQETSNPIKEQGTVYSSVLVMKAKDEHLSYYLESWLGATSYDNVAQSAILIVSELDEEIDSLWNAKAHQTK